jgi:natural product precursor
MKPTKKLKLNKKTIAHLRVEKMAHVYGGVTETQRATICFPKSCPQTCIPCTETNIIQTQCC